jgi:hypothetical protein
VKLPDEVAAVEAVAIWSVGVVGVLSWFPPVRRFLEWRLGGWSASAPLAPILVCEVR